MGRGKIEIKRIENPNNRTATYTKRRNGLIKKAQEITVLCDAKVSLIIFSSNGKMHHFCSPPTTLVDILDDYQRNSGKSPLWDLKHENLSNEVERVKKDNADRNIELRHLKGEDINSLNCRELIALENALQNGLDNIREKQSEFVNTLRDTEELLEAENKRLIYELHQREYNCQMSLAFRVQPMQPNLQDRM